MGRVSPSCFPGSASNLLEAGFTSGPVKLVANQTPLFYPYFLISTAAPNGDSDGGLALGSYINIKIKKKTKNNFNQDKINKNKFNKK